MHEFALVEQLLKLLRESAVENNIEEIQQATVVVGLGSTFVPGVIKFLFESLATEPPFSTDTELVVIKEPVRVYCPACSREFEHDDWRWVCPHCGSTDLRQTAGGTVYIQSYEGE